MSNNHSPFSQFEINPLINMSLFGVDISFSNSSFFMLLAVMLIVIFFTKAMQKPTLVPSRLQCAAEMLYEFVENTLVENAGVEAKKYFPMIFTLFAFILICNLLGMTPYGFTVTSHIIVTFFMSISIFLFVTITAIVKHKFSFFSFFLPAGTPLWLAPLMIIIELFAYLSRPISLSIRLAANMIAGHVLLKVLAGFIIMLGIWGFIPIPLIILLTGFEIFVSILQAYVFTILTCVYLSDALHLH